MTPGADKECPFCHSKKVVNYCAVCGHNLNYFRRHTWRRWIPWMIVLAVVAWNVSDILYYRAERAKNPPAAVEYDPSGRPGY